MQDGPVEIEQRLTPSVSPKCSLWTIVAWMNSGRIQGHLLLPLCCPTVPGYGESIQLPDTIRNEKVTAARLLQAPAAAVRAALFFCSALQGVSV